MPSALFFFFSRFLWQFGMLCVLIQILNYVALFCEKYPNPKILIQRKIGISLGPPRLNPMIAQNKFLPYLVSHLHLWAQNLQIQPTTNQKYLGKEVQKFPNSKTWICCMSETITFSLY